MPRTKTPAAEVAEKSNKTTGSASKKPAKSAAEKEPTLAQRRREELEQQAMSRSRICSILLFAVGILITLFVIIGLISSATASPDTQKNLLDYIYMLLCGVFGFTVFFTGPVVIYAAVLIAANKGKSSILTKVVQLIVGIMLISAAIQIIFVGSVGEGTDNLFAAIADLYSDGINLQGGGLIGGLLAWLLLLFGKVGAIVLILVISFVFIMFISRKTLMEFLSMIGKPVKKAAGTAKEKHRLHKEEMELLRSQQEQERLEFEQQEKKVRTIKELEMANAPIVTNPKEQLEDRHKMAMDEQNKASDVFISELKNYNGIPDSGANKLTKGNNTLPDIAPEEDIHTSVDVLPEFPKIVRKQPENAGNTADVSASQDKPLQPQENIVHDSQNSEQMQNIPIAQAATAQVQSATAAQSNAAQVQSTVAVQASQPQDINSPDNFQESSPAYIDDELPPPPENPPEEINPVEQALQMYTESKEREQKEADIKNAENGSFDDIISSAEQYVLPPTTLLDELVPGKADEDIQKELDNNAKTIVEALRSFGVQTKIIGICRGPSVTRYEIQPAAGVKISKITGLANDIALNLAAESIRIEAPIPNKPAVGIEVPNRHVDTVPFRALIESPAISESKSKLSAVLGKDITGEIIIADIAQMPHLLIAGTTGSGKSVCVNSIIMSILFRSTPDEVRFIMIDPKAVEFMIYNGIPHLLIPVVTDAKKAAGALAWAVTEMLRRYTLFSEYNVRNLQGYNSLAEKEPEMQKMPQIVIFIDELADLIMASKNEVEDSICRLAQMARAAGMHLVIATQRPTVDVVTGLIKANIPSRIALKVGQGVDSRTIIDEQGAEKLLGKGDMLFKSTAMPKPRRVQGCWISDKEVDRVVTFIKNSFILDYDDDVMKEVEKHAELVRSNDKGSGGDIAFKSGGADTDDEKLEEAIRIVVEAEQASISSLQRGLKLGFGRAARLIDTMEEMGIVGPSEGSKPRQVLMTKEEFYQRQMNRQ